MVKFILQKIFGSANQRFLKGVRPIVQRINELEPQTEALSDAALKGRTAEFKQRIDNGEPLDSILPEAFAVVRETARRTLGMRPFDVQLIGGMVLHRGMIAEMRTGEGKTLTATLPVYLNALTGRGVHLVTVNDYLATRDSEWMGRVYRWHGMAVGTILHGLDSSQRRTAYHADVTFGTNNEFGFDYLRDNMRYSMGHYVQRYPHYAIVDEVDSILIDEARTPLIISGPAEDATDLYIKVNQIIPRLRRDLHFSVDEKSRSVILTDDGVARAEELLQVENLYAPQNIEKLHHLYQGLKAHHIFTRDVDYVVREGKVTIVDEFTGRMMPGRRYSDGLHQALEAKEGVTVERENQTLATISFQNYFRMYEKLAGMTGTADTEAQEFWEIYKLRVVVVPTHMPMIRVDHGDAIYRTEGEKFDAIVERVTELYGKGTPVLLGTISIEKSELLSRMLKKRGIRHNVLNAKYHDKEAEIIAQAGRYKAVTISTNMAGRGTDIVLGGNPEFLARQKVGPEASLEEFKAVENELKGQCAEEKKAVIEAGGLFVLGSERHESRRIDNQLRGRSGRQGDPGASQFYLSMQDDVMRIFGGERMMRIMERIGIREGEEIQHPMLTRAVENSQRKVEGHNFDIRKNLLEYDDVMNQQRSTIYNLRREVMGGARVGPERQRAELARLIAPFVPEKFAAGGFDRAAVAAVIREYLETEIEVSDWPEVRSREQLADRLAAALTPYFRKIERQNGALEVRHLPAKMRERIARERILDVIEDTIIGIVSTHASDKLPRNQWNVQGVFEDVVRIFHIQLPFITFEMAETDVLVTVPKEGQPDPAGLEGDGGGQADGQGGFDLPAAEEEPAPVETETRTERRTVRHYAFAPGADIGSADQLQQRVYAEVEKLFLARETDFTPSLQRRLEVELHIQILDKLWKEHLLAMDHLREGIGLRGYGQKDPKREYQREGFGMFQTMIARIGEELLEFLFKVQLRREEELEQFKPKSEEQKQLTYGRSGGRPAPARTVKRTIEKVGRNDPCPCGSGQKFKKCHWGKPGYDQYM